MIVVEVGREPPHAALEDGVAWFRCCECGVLVRVVAYLRGELGEWAVFGCAPCRRRYVLRLDGEPVVWAEDTTEESNDARVPRVWGCAGC